MKRLAVPGSQAGLPEAPRVFQGLVPGASNLIGSRMPRPDGRSFFGTGTTKEKKRANKPCTKPCKSFAQPPVGSQVVFPQGDMIQAEPA